MTPVFNKLTNGSLAGGVRRFSNVSKFGMGYLLSLKVYIMTKVLMKVFDQVLLGDM